MSSMWELKQWNVWGNHLKINYKIVLKAVRHLYKQMSWTEELFCPLRVTVHRVACWQIWQFVISCSFLCSLQNLRWTDQHDHSSIHLLWCMRHVWLKGKVTCSEKTCICVSDRYMFSPRSSQTTHLLIGFN